MSRTRPDATNAERKPGARFKAHICFVSDQPLPNILPVLHEDMKPEKVYLLCSEQQAKQGNGEAQKAVLEHKGVTVEVVEVADAYDMEHIETAVNELINNHQPDEIVFNATGGTKLMSIAAFEQCLCGGIGVFYVQTPDVLWLNAPGSGSEEKPVITESLSLSDFLKAHGVDLLESEISPIVEPLKSLACSWANRAGESEWESRYGAINYYARKASEDESLAFSVPSNEQHGNLLKLLGELECNNLIEFIEGEKHRFKDEASRQFANGGWLEAWVFDELQSLRTNHPQISVVARNVTVQQRPGSTRSDVKNELDVVAVVSHRMWVFECKTARFQGPQPDRRSGEEMVYKLASTMKNMGGLRTQGCVVSFNSLRNVEKSRAELLEIEVIDGSNLKDLRSKLVQALGLKK